MTLIKRDHDDEMYTRKGCRETHDRLYGLQRISGHIRPLKEKKALTESQLNKEQKRKSERIK